MVSSLRYQPWYRIAVARGAEKKFENNFSGDAKTQPPARLGFGFSPLRLVAPLPPRTRRRPRRVRRGVRRGRDGVGVTPVGVGVNPITALSVASRSRGRSRRVRAVPGSKADAPGERPLSSPHHGAIRVAASSAGHRAHARGGARRAPPRACASRAPRCDRTNPSCDHSGHRRRCRDQCA